MLATAAAMLDRAVALLCDGAGGAADRALIRLLARRPGASQTSRLSSICASRWRPRSRRRRLLARAQAVERALGRDRAHEQRWGPRTADIDIIAYDDLTLDELAT